MPNTFTLNISTPEKEFYCGEVESLVLSSPEGKMGVLPSHSLMVVALDTAPISFRAGEEQHIAALSGGFAQIKGSQVVILADSAEWPEEIELNRALEAKRRAEERLNARLGEEEHIRAQVALRRAITRLDVAKSK